VECGDCEYLELSYDEDPCRICEGNSLWEADTSTHQKKMIGLLEEIRDLIKEINI